MLNEIKIAFYNTKFKMQVDIINIIEGIQAGLPVESCNLGETDQAMFEH